MPDRRAFVTQLAAGAVLLPAALRRSAAAQNPVYDTIPGRTTAGSRELVPWRPEPFLMNQVSLRPGIFLTARNANQAYLHLLPNDRLAHMFRVTSGLPSNAQPLGGWEAPNVELRGHFSGGHYLSAAALMYAATGDDALLKKANALVADLAACQKANGNGYLSAFPVSFFDRLREGKPVWAPFYTLHKILAGHLDMYVHGGNEQALQSAEGLAGWVGRWSQPLSYDLMQRILLTEFGGMCEVLYNLYAVTGKEYYAATARRFEKAVFFDPLEAHRDELKGLHANTHIPQVIGAARGYELTREPRYYDIANYFWHEVTSERIYCTGGTSNGEYWRSDPGHLHVGPACEECCCGYNMLKLTRHVFGWSGAPAAMDYYERTLFNSRLGTQDGHGLKQYFVALEPGTWRTFNTPFDSFWCCTGTGAEEFSKFNDTI
ncbi:MAG: beta-L-arabinofuranosidase domain-containing protein, partial [Terriglobales bacterium]